MTQRMLSWRIGRRHRGWRFPWRGCRCARSPHGEQSLDAAYTFKTEVLAEFATLTTALRQRTDSTELAAADVLSTATSLAGAFWQMAAPGTDLRALYESRPELTHAIVDVEPRLTRILTALLAGVRH
ncbi:hypothetical protein ACQP1G_34955 [Nocardia sp. CA-107356]|uniref:hypothetical protein n=1 Tax=Nocardia sp. CA-107356 TaxID=3239972 RepID=UPI003D8CC674